MNILLRRLNKNALWKPSFLNNFKKKPTWKVQSSARSMPSKTWAAFLLGISTLNELRHYSRVAFCDEGTKTEEKNKTEEEITREEKIAMLKKIYTYEIGLSTDFEEGKIKEVKIMHEDKELTVIVTRVEGKLYATSAYCTYDDKTPLKEGVVFGDKIYAPIYGSAYSVKTGTVEYGPALDNLAIFFVREVKRTCINEVTFAKKEGKVLLGVPKYPPKKIRPMASFRDYNDLRKVVIIGSGIAALACIESLRQNGYTGEIKMVSKDTLLPYDKTRLSKTFKNLKYEELLVRPEEYYDDQGIEYLLGREVKLVSNKHGNPHIELEDGLKLEYDALLVASGANPTHREIPGLTETQDNVTYLRNIEDHKKIRQKLEKAKNVIIVGANLYSLETAATIRTEYPKVNVHVIDENETCLLDDKFGREVTDVLLDLHKKNGVKFTFAKTIEKFLGDASKAKQLQLDDGTKVSGDLFLLFPNNMEANTDFLMDQDSLDNLEFDEEGRLKVDFNQRSEHKRIFGAGDASAGMYFLQTKRMPSDSWYTAYHGGMVAAYNILALDIPNAVVPFTYTKQYNHFFNYSGFASYYNDIYIDGDVKNMDFIAYYSIMGEVLAAFGTEKRKRDMLVINEAFRLDLMPTVTDIKEGKENIQTIENRIRNSKRSGCFRDLIQDIKYQANPEHVIWMQREKSNEYHNFWQEGKQPMGTNVVKDEE